MMSRTVVLLKVLILLHLKSTGVSWTLHGNRMILGNASDTTAPKSQSPGRKELQALYPDHPWHMEVEVGHVAMHGALSCMDASHISWCDVDD